MKTPCIPAATGVSRRLITGLIVALAAGAGPMLDATPSVVTSHDAYAIGEDIAVEFKGGPGNPLDWVGIYPSDVVPGAQPSTLWFYVDGTRNGQAGLTEGQIFFPGGLSFSGDWKASFLLNDGYGVLAETPFKVVEPGTPLVRTDKRNYAPGENIVASFLSGPGNAKDWVGIYKADQTPGGPTSTVWYYVDGTQSGSTGVTDGSLTFSGGLTDPGNYIAFFLLNDGYDVLATETFSVVAPTGSQPRLLSIQPTDGASNVPPLFQFTAKITNGVSKVVLPSVAVLIDGTAVEPIKTSENDLVTVSHSATTLLAPQSTHTYKLTYRDDATPPNNNEINGTFTIATYENILLPAPIVFENFDATPEGQVPPGWTLQSYTEVGNADLDLGNLDSASFANWTVLSVDRFRGSFVTYSNPDNPDSYETDYQRVLTPNPLNVVNGQVVTNLATGNLLFGDSGYRNGRSQVLYTYTPDFDLTGKTDVYVVFNSLYEQNQDSIGALEYSIDGGTTWLPVVYLLDGPDVVRTEAGEIDAEATFNNTAGDIAVYTDENGTDVGGSYGAFIGAPISPALAPYIQARVDNDPRESKRVEKYRLPQADNQKKVRFRFAYAGTDSWYWGVDNFGLYSIGSIPVTPPTLTFAATSEGLNLSWPADATGYVLEGIGALGSSDWTVVPGVSGHSAVVPYSSDAQYFRLRAP